MIKAGTGSSLNHSGEAAGREAAESALSSAGISEADWALVFYTFPHQWKSLEMLKSICAALGTENVSGCSGIGLLTDKGEVEGEPAVAVLAVQSDTVTATTFLVDSAMDDGLASGVKVAQSIAQKITKGEAGNKLLALLPDPFTNHSEYLFTGIESKLDPIDIVGATSSLHPGINETYQCQGSNSVMGGVAGLYLEGDFNHKIGITQGCQPTGKPFTITSSEGNLIFELDGKSAFDVMKAQIPDVLLGELAEIPRLVFAAFPPNPEEKEIVEGEYLVRNLMGLNPETGIVAVAQNVKDGDMMQFTVRHPTMAREDLKQMLSRVSPKGNGSESVQETPKFALYFNCCGRGASLYGHEGIDTAYITSSLGDVPLIGIFGNSEFAPLRGVNRVFTYTGVLVVISE